MSHFKICDCYGNHKQFIKERIREHIIERIYEESILDKIIKCCSPANGSILVYNGSKWCVRNMDTLIHNHEGGDKGDKGDKGDTVINAINESVLIGSTTEVPNNPSKSSVYVGYEAGKNEITDENVYVGHNTGSLTSGGLNTFIGAKAGNKSTGTQCVYVGNNVCSNTESSGSYNLMAGSEAGFNNTTGFGNTFLGTVAGSTNTEGSWNVFIGQSAGQNNDVGSNHVFIGTNTGITNIAGNSCICIGDSADTSSEVPINQIVFGQGVVSYGDNTITFPNNLKSLPIGTEVNFSSTNGGCLYPVSSSIRWKENVQDISQLIDTSKLYKLRPVTYNPAVGHGNPYELHIGLIAEEVEEYFPTIVPKDIDGRPASVRYSMISVLLLEELKKLKVDIDEIKKKVELINVE
jgi:hypothetical protein